MGTQLRSPDMSQPHHQTLTKNAPIQSSDRSPPTRNMLQNSRKWPSVKGVKITRSGRYTAPTTVTTAPVTTTKASNTEKRNPQGRSGRHQGKLLWVICNSVTGRPNNAAQPSHNGELPQGAASQAASKVTLGAASQPWRGFLARL